MKQNEEGVTLLPDSGERTQFGTGAVRDIQVGKGRCDLLPLDILAIMLKAPTLKSIECFKETKECKFLEDAIEMFAAETEVDVYTLMLEVAKHFESGAIKYGDNNWKKGIDLHCYISSGVRHYLKYRRGDTDEPHDRAFVWNMLCADWTYRHMPELDDINIDEPPEVNGSFVGMDDYMKNT